MKILIVGAAGNVGSVIRPALEAQHECTFFDLKPIPDRASRCIVADVNDEAAVERAVAGVQAVVYLAMGVIPGSDCDVQDPNLAFLVNACGWYRFLRQGLKAGARRFVYASSLSVYTPYYRTNDGVLDESRAPDSWDPYGLTKRVGEFIGQAAVQRQPDATIVALRLMHPMDQKAWDEWRVLPPTDPLKVPQWLPMHPNDTRRLFLAAVALDKPGVHIVHTTGDLKAGFYSHAKALELLGWRAQGN